MRIAGNSNSYHEVFRGRHTVLPVIHVETRSEALSNAQIAREAGADGVFLINHGMADEPLLEIHASVADAHPGWWIGVNCLGITPDDVFRSVSERVCGVWADNAGIEEGQEEQPYAKVVLDLRNMLAPSCLYFGGVAFKYQRHVQALEQASRLAAQFMDVVNNSGPGTGQAAPVDKIRRMKLVLGDRPLAIASGVTPENVGDYLPHADSFLVATGISRSFTELDPARLKALIRRVRSFGG
jgi:uncharacterized protein